MLGSRVGNRLEIRFIFLTIMDPISDMLTKIRNAQAVGHEAVNIIFSKLKLSIAEILKAEGFIEDLKKRGRKIEKNIEIILKYNDGLPAISGLKRISRSSQRIYRNKERIKPVKQGFGIAILSTSRGLMTDKEARKKKLGGEVICEVW